MGANSSRKDELSKYDRLVELLRGPAVPGPDLRLLAPIVADDLRDRHELARAAPRPPGLVEQSAVEILQAHPYMISRWKRRTPLYLLGWVVAVGIIRPVTGGWGIVALATGLVLTALLLEAKRTARGASFDPGSSACPACSYDLSGLPDGIPSKLVGGSVGPPRCPECGWAWPRVP